MGGWNILLHYIVHIHIYSLFFPSRPMSPGRYLDHNSSSRRTCPQLLKLPQGTSITGRNKLMAYHGPTSRPSFARRRNILIPTLGRAPPPVRVDQLHLVALTPGLGHANVDGLDYMIIVVAIVHRPSWSCHRMMLWPWRMRLRLKRRARLADVRALMGLGGGAES